MTDHLYRNHERRQNQPNFIELCLRQVEDEIRAINGLLALFAQREEGLRTLVLSRPLPRNKLLEHGNHPLQPFSTRRIFNTLERMQEGQSA